MTLTIEVRARPGKAIELYQTLQALIPTMRRQGCPDCNVSQKTEGGESFLFSGDWDAFSTFEAFIRSAGGSALLGAVDLLSEMSRVRIGDGPWGGIEILKRMRNES